MDIRLVIEKGSNKPETIHLRSEETIIGREKGCDLRIPSAGVSRRHCRLSFRDDVLEIEDLDSANGTFVNDVMVEGSQVLRPGDRLEVGPVTFVVKYQLTPAAINRLLKEDAGASQVLEVEVEELVEEIPETEVEDEEAKAGAAKKKGRSAKGQDRKTAAKKEPKKPDASGAGKKSAAAQKKSAGKKEPPPAKEDIDPEVASLFDEGSSWHIPASEDIRDIFSNLGDK